MQYFVDGNSGKCVNNSGGASSVNFVRLEGQVVAHGKKGLFFFHGNDPFLNKCSKTGLRLFLGTDPKMFHYVNEVVLVLSKCLS